MPPNQPKKARPRSLPETGPHVWEKMREFFEDEKAYLKSVRDEDGLEAAQLEHSCQMAELGSEDDWRNMFMQAYLREPKSAQAIKEAQLAYLMFHNRILPLEKEQMNELNMIHCELMDVLRKFREYIEQCHSAMREPSSILGLKAIHEELEQYEGLAMHSREARMTIEEIRVMIDEIDRLGKKYSK